MLGVKPCDELAIRLRRIRNPSGRYDSSSGDQRKPEKSFDIPLIWIHQKIWKKLKHETLKTIGKDDERLTFWFSIDQNNRSANDLEQWD